MENIKKHIIMKRFADYRKCMNYIKSHAKRKELYWKNDFGILLDYQVTKKSEVFLTITSLKNPALNIKDDLYSFVVISKPNSSILFCRNIQDAIEKFEETVIHLSKLEENSIPYSDSSKKNKLLYVI